MYQEKPKNLLLALNPDFHDLLKGVLSSEDFEAILRQMGLADRRSKGGGYYCSRDILE